MELINLMTSIKKIESSLLAKFSKYFKVDLWNEFIANLFFMKRLLTEKKTNLLKQEVQPFVRSHERIDTFLKISIQLKDLSVKQQSRFTCDL